MSLMLRFITLHIHTNFSVVAVLAVVRVRALRDVLAPHVGAAALGLALAAGRGVGRVAVDVATSARSAGRSTRRTRRLSSLGRSASVKTASMSATSVTTSSIAT